jgi:hypothetical protein
MLVRMLQVSQAKGGMCWSAVVTSNVSIAFIRVTLVTKSKKGTDEEDYINIALVTRALATPCKQVNKQLLTDCSQKGSRTDVEAL